MPIGGPVPAKPTKQFSNTIYYMYIEGVGVGVARVSPRLRSPALFIKFQWAFCYKFNMASKGKKDNDDKGKTTDISEVFKAVLQLKTQLEAVENH